MDEIQRAKIVFKILNKTYPSIYVPLKSRNVFTLLISVLLSAQCTDVNVNNVTKDIYLKYYKPKHFVKLGRKKIEKLIKKIGIFRIKAKSIYNLSKLLIEKQRMLVISDFKLVALTRHCQSQNRHHHFQFPLQKVHKSQAIVTTKLLLRVK